MSNKNIYPKTSGHSQRRLVITFASRPLHFRRNTPQWQLDRRLGGSQSRSESCKKRNSPRWESNAAPSVDQPTATELSVLITVLKEQGSFNLVQNTVHKGPVLKLRCIGPGRARTHILFYYISPNKMAVILQQFMIYVSIHLTFYGI
jgi:hypothetical protein